METVEPVFGQIKAGRGFRQFLLRGLEKVNGEWSLICTGHNLLKLFRSGRLASRMSMDHPANRARGMDIPPVGHDFAHFKPRRRVNPQVGGTGQPGLSIYPVLRLGFVQSSGIG